MLLEAAQRDLPKEKLESLMVERETTHCVSGAERVLLVVSSRSQKNPPVAYDRECLPGLVHLYMWERNNKYHGGQESMVIRTRAKVLIITARRMAKKIKRHCLKCKYLAKQCRGA